MTAEEMLEAGLVDELSIAEHLEDLFAWVYVEEEDRVGGPCDVQECREDSSHRVMNDIDGSCSSTKVRLCHRHAEAVQELVIEAELEKRRKESQ